MSKAWEHFLEVSPDLALLQEVNSISPGVQAEYSSVVRPARTQHGDLQRFSTAVLSRYDLAAASLNSEFSWVREQLAIFKGNLVAATFKIDGIPEIKVVSVHVPTWPLDATDLTPKDLQKIKLEHNSRVWATELLWSAMVAERDYDGWLVVGGDLNTSVTFDKMWSGGPHGNQEVLDRLHALELTECLVTAQGCLTATFQNASDKKVIHQIDHLFVSHPLAARLVECGVSDRDLIFGESLSDHLPIIADFKIGT